MALELPSRPGPVQMPGRSGLPARTAGPVPHPLPPRPAGTPGAVPGAVRPRALAPNAALQARIDLTADLARFRVRPDAGVPAFRPGQYVSIGLPGEAGPIIRPYSIASGSVHGAALELLVRRLDGGALTTRLWALAPGDRLWLGPVRGLFHLDPDPSPATVHLFLGGGTGLAPIVAMLAELAVLPASRRPRAALVQGATRVAELAYHDRFRRWASEGWLRYLPTISRPGAPGNGDWRGATGRVETHVARLVGAMGVGAPGGIRAWLCGNDGMVDAGRAALLAAGVLPADIRWESFTPARGPARAAPGAPGISPAGAPGAPPGHRA